MGRSTKWELQSGKRQVEAYKRASIYGKMSENWIMGASLQNDRPKWGPMFT